MPQSEPTTVLLDADGVLQRASAGFVSSIEALCADPAHRADFIADVFGAERPCLTGAGDFPAALAEVLANWGIRAPVSEALALWSQIDPEPAILDAVARLRRDGVRVGLATNQQSHRANVMAAELRYRALFDDLFFSCELGVAKPSAKFFDAILGRLGLPAQRVLFIDDRPENVSAAHRAGMSAEVYHLDEGPERFATLLEGYGL